jgi:AraC-like DNA-binding protein
VSFFSYIPEPPLSAFVETIWWMTDGRATASRERICPNGAMALVVHLTGRHLSFFHGDNRQSVRVPLLAGPFSKSFLVDRSEFTAVLGVRFKPGAGRVFFPVPPHELHNIDVALGDLDPREAVRLMDELLSAGTLAARFRVLERYLAGKIPSGLPPHPAVEHAIREFQKTPGVRAIADVQSETGFSHTRFNQIFREHVGLTPKLFCRILRFQTVLRQIEIGHPVNWAGVAAGCGYFDQAHLIHDFRAFAGITPVAYVQKQESPERNAAPASAAG